MEGFLLIHKPSGVTSRHCVNHIFNVIKQSTGNKVKIGHTGTLDFFARGLLIVGISRSATRIIDRIMTLDKIYSAKARLGECTDTLDCTGVVLKVENIAHLHLPDRLLTVISNFENAYEQMPPLYSALKHNGRRLSDLARANNRSQEELKQILNNKKKVVQIYNLALHTYEAPFFTIRAHVSHGTYIRTLVDDIAQRMQTHATTHDLVRESIGPFLLESATALSNISIMKDIEKNYISVESIVHMLDQYLGHKSK